MISLTVTAVSKTGQGTVTASVSACPAGRGLCRMWLTSPAPGLRCGRTARLWRRAQRSKLEPARIQQCPLWYPYLFGAAVAAGQCRGERPALGEGTARRPPQPVWQPAPARSGAGSAPGPFLRPAGAASPLDRSMSGEEAPDTQEDPEGAGTWPEEVPSLKEIEQLLNTGRPSCNHVDEVWPNLFLGDL